VGTGDQKKRIGRGTGIKKEKNKVSVRAEGRVHGNLPAVEDGKKQSEEKETGLTGLSSKKEGLINSNHSGKMTSSKGKPTLRENNLPSRASQLRKFSYKEPEVAGVEMVSVAG